MPSSACQQRMSPYAGLATHAIIEEGKIVNLTLRTVVQRVVMVVIFLIAMTVFYLALLSPAVWATLAHMWY
jgi:hypothetical protein